MARKQKSSSPLIGAHMSIAGGVQHALERGQAVGCRTIQVFTKNANQWRAKPLAEDDIREFKRLSKETGIAPVVAHDSYLINIASPDPKKLGASRAALLDEMERVEALEIPYLVMHPGAHMGAGEKEGLRQISRSLDELHARTRGFAMKILLETTAGQGTNLGYRFEQLGAILGDVAEPERLGVCVDTCHIFAAGYEIRTVEGYEKTMEDLFGQLGSEGVQCVHINDSLKAFESRVDRHAHIGKGEIGLDAFCLLMNDPRFVKIPKILETPKGDNDEMDLKNLAVLRGLIRQ
jgi:deoxyribonuclease-4